MDKVPAPLKGIPILPVGVAALVGFSLGLAVSILIDAQAARKAPPQIVHGPCKECAERAAKPSVVSEVYGASQVQKMADPYDPSPSAMVVAKDANVPD